MKKNKLYGNQRHQKIKRWKRESRENGQPPQRIMTRSEGYVYIFDVGNRLYKIGMSGNFQVRLNALSASNPNIKVIMAIQVTDARQCEKHLHHTFRGIRHSRELFHLKSEHIAYAEEYLNKNAIQHPAVIPVGETSCIAPSGWKI